ncbi:MAG: 50S ribosomal protein L23 [Saprospiraceae bacterium]|nr:50S ribosomal protein L23 [Saprospiraceae bacterium]
MAKDILIKPLITEKAENLSEKKNQFTFLVDRKSNKIEIRKAVEKMYNVHVSAVNTAIMPSKTRNRNTKAGFIRGSVSAYKKAVVTLAPGETIDLYGEI